MYLVLAPEHDASAQWAAAGLRARGLTPVECVSPAALVQTARWDHRVDAQGVRTLIRLDDGREFKSEAIQGVLNRIPYLPVELFARGRAEDRQYAQQEFTALFMSALGALESPVWNRPTAQGSGGAWRHPSEWMMLAGRAGLRARPYRETSRPAPPRHTVFVLGDRVAGAPAELHDACARFAALARTGLLGLEFDDDWLFAHATPQPDLRLGGDALLDALKESFSA